MDIKNLIDIIEYRQGLSWDDSRLETKKENELEEWFEYINKPDVKKEQWFYNGYIYRVHIPYPKLEKDIDKKTEKRVSEPCSDGSCSVLKNTVYGNELKSFSKSYDFLSDAFPKIKEISDTKCIFIQVNTKTIYGIDVNELITSYYGYKNRYYNENEVLFPLKKEFVEKEHTCEPKYFIDEMDSQNTIK